jgi:microcystin degradation protein MlrC
MRIGIIGLLHESNTFLHRPTTLEDFQNQTLLTGEAIREKLAATHHELGGFFAGLDADPAGDAVAVPLFVGRSLPSGTVAAETWNALLERMFAEVDPAGRLDGILVAPHGATVSEEFPDADGDWLSRLRDRVGPDVPLIGTVDAHANLSPKMVAACNAITSYRSNPHLDQRERGIEAAKLMLGTLRGEVAPAMHAEFPPLAINIERQLTDEPHLKALYEIADGQLANPRMLTNSIVLGFPYADVAEMGSSVIAVADSDASLARESAQQLAREMWSRREDFVGQLIGIDEALARARELPQPVCLLDMGDNVGGGSAGDGTALLAALHQARFGPSFVCIADAEAVRAAESAGLGATVELTVGGKTDDLHGEPLTAQFTVRSLHEGRFSESQVRHGGMSEFDQGRTAVVEADSGVTVMLTTRRMVPFSLAQLTSCGLNPAHYEILVAKGVNAPVAAYREVCRSLLRVNTPGSTCADMTQLEFHNRRRPLFPFEPDTQWECP